MIKRFLVASACIIAMPMCFSLQESGRSTIGTPFSSVALAGRTFSGGYYCTCGCPDCICDPGETPVECRGSNSVTTNPISDDQTAPISDPSGSSGLDFGSGALLLAIGFMLWTRLDFARNL